MSAVHDFTEDLQRSAQDAYLQFLLTRVYLLQYPTMVGLKDYYADLDAQRGGYDRGVLLQFGQERLVEEKLCQNKYSSLPLEYISVGNDDGDCFAPGWVTRDDVQCDDLLVMRACPEQPVTSLRITWRDLRTVWEQYKGAWVNPPYQHSTHTRRANGSRYTTWFAAVPLHEFVQAVTHACGPAHVSLQRLPLICLSRKEQAQYEHA